MVDAVAIDLVLLIWRTRCSEDRLLQSLRFWFLFLRFCCRLLIRCQCGVPSPLCVVIWCCVEVSPLHFVLCQIFTEVAKIKLDWCLDRKLAPRSEFCALVVLSGDQTIVG